MEFFFCGEGEGAMGGGSFFNSKKEFKELFFRSKNHPDIEELEYLPKRSYPVPKIVTLI